jgi:transcriptional regulator with XRE-family HTH domain
MTTMATADRELDRVLTLLRNKIRERGFTQLEVQEALSWGRSYISQLLTKQKSLRVEQVLLILEVIGVEPGEFYGELYQYPQVDTGLRGMDEYGMGRQGRSAPFNPSAVHELSDTPLGGEVRRSFHEVRSLIRGLVRLLVDRSLINVDELAEAVKACDVGSMIDDLQTGSSDISN